MNKYDIQKGQYFHMLVEESISAYLYWQLSDLNDKENELAYERYDRLEDMINKLC